MAVRERRDMRDPRKLGEALLSTPKRGRLSTRYDRHHASLLLTPAYTGEGEGIALEEKAKYALEFPNGLPVGDDPGGA